MQYIGEHPVQGRVHPLLKIYHLCSAMEFRHLPWPGAISDQHPEVIDFFQYMWGEKAAHDKSKREQEKKNAPRTPSGSRGRR